MAENRSLIPDKICIENLRCHGVIGLREPERCTPQDILVSAILEIDLHEVAAADAVVGGLNYKDVVRRIQTHVNSAERFTIEALATEVAGLCLADREVSRVIVRISKPSAIEVADAVAAEICRTYDELVAPALIGLSSNDAPESNFRAAIQRLSLVGSISCASKVYESAAIEQSAANYLNAVVRVDSCLPAGEIRRILKSIEQHLGRAPESKSKAEIPIDLDLCMLGSQVMRAKDATIPDEDILSREYLAKGCAEVLPHGRYPQTNEPLVEIANRLSGTSKLKTRQDIRLLG